mgnify:CR=1 FL=1
MEKCLNIVCPKCKSVARVKYTLNDSFQHTGEMNVKTQTNSDDIQPYVYYNNDMVKLKSYIEHGKDKGMLSKGLVPLIPKSKPIKQILFHLIQELSSEL